MLNTNRLAFLPCTFLIVCFISTCQAYAGELPGPNPFDAPPHLAVYKDETIFVRVPARIGDVGGGIAGCIVGAPVGLVVGIFCLPKTGLVGLVLPPIYLGAIAGVYGRKAGAAVVGFPFYCLQKIFYDFPNKIINSNEQSEQTITTNNKEEYN